MKHSYLITEFNLLNNVLFLTEQVCVDKLVIAETPGKEGGRSKIYIKLTWLNKKGSLFSLLL